MANKHCFFLTFFVLATVIINTLLVILSAIFLNVDPYVLKSNNNIIQNWNRTLILDIQLAKDKCPYNYEPLVLGYTEGILTGQVCNSKSRKYNYTSEVFTEASMGNKYSGKSCLSVSQTRATPIVSWRNTLICALKSSYKYTDLVSIPSEGKCMNGLIKCPNPYDTLNQYMCVRHLFECGINYMKVINTNDSYNSNLYTKLNFFDGQKSLLIGRGISYSPTIVDFKITKGNNCAYPLERGFDKSYFFFESYPYANGCKTRLGGNTNNPYLYLLDTDTETHVYSSIKGKNSVLASLPLYPTNFLSNNDYNLYYSTYVGFSANCVWSADTINNFYFADNEFNFSGGGLGILICGGVLMAFIIFSIFAQGDRGCRYDSCCMTWYYFLYFFIPLTMMIVGWVYYTIFNNTAFYHFLYINYLSKEKMCLDNFHTQLVDLEYASTRYFTDFYIIVSVWVTLLFCMQFFIKICGKCLNKYFDWDYQDGTM
jgi:hypothetical protein